MGMQTAERSSVRALFQAMGAIAVTWLHEAVARRRECWAGPGQQSLTSSHAIDLSSQGRGGRCLFWWPLGSGQRGPGEARWSCRCCRLCGLQEGHQLQALGCSRLIICSEVLLLMQTRLEASSHHLHLQELRDEGPLLLLLFPASPGDSHRWGLASMLSMPFAGMQLAARFALQLGPDRARGGLLLGQNRREARHPELSPRTPWFGASLGAVLN